VCLVAFSYNIFLCLYKYTWVLFLNYNS
jgi:hypothetical protein